MSKNHHIILLPFLAAVLVGLLALGHQAEANRGNGALGSSS